MTSTEFLIEKGFIISPPFTKFIIKFEDGKEINLAELLDEWLSKNCILPFGEKCSLC